MIARSPPLLPAGIERFGAELWVRLVVSAPLVMDPDLLVQAQGAADQALLHLSLRQHLSPAWLPRGEYTLRLALDQRVWAALTRVTITPGWRQGNAPVWGTPIDHVAEDLGAQAARPSNGVDAIVLEHRGDSVPIDRLSWKRGHEDWFHKHFEHAARTTISYLLKDHPLVRGRILDVGCGDGITDLGIALYCEPEQLIGIDPFGGFARLPEVMRENHVPADAYPSCLSFASHDANALPYPDNSFDVVLSWGSLEHIAGGYQQALGEIRRVLRDGGLFFAHPGLYYSASGHHLGEFCAQPHFHLQRSAEEVRRIVFETPPKRIDRSGQLVAAAQYWQWYGELNRITVDSFERDLRALGFEPWRVAIRSEPMLEYTAELLHYPMQQLATAELYLSCFNRKGRRSTA